MADARRHMLGTVRELPDGSCRILRVGRREIGVYNVGGDFYTVRNTCPHHGAPICMGMLSGTMMPSEPGEYGYGMDRRALRCPWHGWEFDIETGRALFGVDRARLVTYPVAVEDGQLVIAAKGI